MNSTSAFSVVLCWNSSPASLPMQEWSNRPSESRSEPLSLCNEYAFLGEGPQSARMQTPAQTQRNGALSRTPDSGGLVRVGPLHIPHPSKNHRIWPPCCDQGFLPRLTIRYVDFLPCATPAQKLFAAAASSTWRSDCGQSLQANHQSYKADSLHWERSEVLDFSAAPNFGAAFKNSG